MYIQIRNSIKTNIPYRTDWCEQSLIALYNWCKTNLFTEKIQDSLKNTKWHAEYFEGYTKTEYCKKIARTLWHGMSIGGIKIVFEKAFGQCPSCGDFTTAKYMHGHPEPDFYVTNCQCPYCNAQWTEYEQYRPAGWSYNNNDFYDDGTVQYDEETDDDEHDELDEVD